MAMTFRPSKTAAKILEQTKKEVGIATNSKVLEFIIHQFPVQQQEIEGLYINLDKTESELKNIKIAITNKTESDLAYNRIVDGLVSK